jgi:benzoate-CoA ligase
MSVELPERFNAASALVDSHLAEGRADKPAILSGSECYTYRRLAEAVDRLGNALRLLGVRMEERVALLLPDSPAFAIGFFAAMKIGAVAVPMNTMLKTRDYEYLLSDSRARVLVVDSGLVPLIEPIRAKLRHLHHVIVAGNDGGPYLALDEVLRCAAATLEPAETCKDDSAFWLYSSGTTGFPKAAVHLHHDMLFEADLYARQVLGLRTDDVSFSVAKLFFAYGLGNGLYFPLRLGATTILLPERPTPERVFQTVDRFQPTVFYSVPTSYAAMLHLAEKTGRTSLGRVRRCVSAGEPLPKAVYDKWLSRFGVEILDGIGSTEILHIFISNQPGRSRAGSTGQIVPGYEAKIVDDDGHPVPTGEVGTLWIKGDSIATCYWNKHEQTKGTFHGKWINTHDKFRVDEDGYFWYAGRTDDLMKVSGQAVWPADLESLLQGHPAVLECGVIGDTDEEGLLKPRAYVVLKEGFEPSADLSRELQEFVKKNTAPFKYPRWIEFVDCLPKTATGKIKRFELRMRLAEERAKAAEQSPPQSDSTSNPDAAA